MAHLELAASPLNTTWTPLAIPTVEDATQVAAGFHTQFARNQAITKHMPLVRLLARQMLRQLPRHVDLEDLVSTGTLGLIEAASRYSCTRDVQFGSYAQVRIKGAMLDSLRRLDWGPRSLRRQGRKIEQAVQVLTAKGLSSPSDADIADEMGLPLAQYQQLLSDLTSSKLSSLQVEYPDGTGEQEIDHIQGSPTEDPLFRCLQGEARNRLAAVIDTLPKKERIILSLHYHEELTMREVSQVMGISQSRVSQMHASAIARLRISLPCDMAIM